MNNRCAPREDAVLYENMKPFRVGVIGIGDISDVYFNNLKKFDAVEVVACASRGLEKAQAKAKRHGIPRAYADGEEIVADPEIDIVLNLTVPAAHGHYNLEALEAGKHVYTEKPLAATFDEAQQIISLARERGLYVGSAPDTFLGARLQTCRELIESGELGEVIGTSAFVVSHGHEWHHPNPDYFYQPGGGPIHDIGPYYFTALLSLFGPVARTAGLAQRRFDARTIENGPRRGESFAVDPDVMTHVTGNLDFENGISGTFIASFDVWDSQLPRIEIYGTKGTICVPDLDPIAGPNLFGGPVHLITRENYRWRTRPLPNPLPTWRDVPIRRRYNETSHDENSRGLGLVDMAYAIRDGRVPRASGEMALHMMEVLDAILQSAREKRFVEVESRFALPMPLPVDFPESEER